MIKIAFASTDTSHVDLHFGAAERFVIYDVSPGQAELVAVGEFVPKEMKGELRFHAISEPVEAPAYEPMEIAVDDPDKPKEDKVAVKLEFLRDCAAVYAASIGTSSIKRLVGAGIQPIIVDNKREIVACLNEVSLALRGGVLAWVDKALAKQKKTDRFDAMAEEGWDDSSKPAAMQNRAVG